MYLKYLNTTAEKTWLSAEISQTIDDVYFVEVCETRVYLTEYRTNTGYNYWEWYLIPKEILIKPSSKFTLKRNRLKPTEIKAKPLLFNNLQILPLRI